MIVVKLILWFDIYLTQLSGIIFNLISLIVFFITIFGGISGTEIKSETIKMLVVGFVAFIILHIGNCFLVKVAILESTLHDFIYDLLERIFSTIVLMKWRI